ncbi:hypothetical protein A8H35_23645 [Burkholderia thailandensis]|nr:hypothetical protein WJ27_29160 [Burkholderia thailandensis]AWY61214.1 hypothetical protein A8H35_23645 [Burkholderia thailandensis]AWY65289.1 hypothetical protein A8H36_08790 [Burkholderia thailandensis]KVG17239.1 hypothetical protein WJ25_21350 [Burkholderia thailandensis]KVG24239.1 hypothetical protein WJ28_18945 [Burkholderia thailandensis]
MTPLSTLVRTASIARAACCGCDSARHVAVHAARAFAEFVFVRRASAFARSAPSGVRVSRGRHAPRAIPPLA